MSDAKDIIDYLRRLKKGFDKDEFASYISNLGSIVDSSGLNYEDFHNLFKIWINLTVPITKWTSIGVCLVPNAQVEERTVHYALRWLLSNYNHDCSNSRIPFILNWLTAAMDHNAIDINALDFGYELFYNMFAYDRIASYVVKLLYTLTKPQDATRIKTLHLLELLKMRHSGKAKTQVYVLLGLFKSYRPECVPENIPALTAHTAFSKINATLLERFHSKQQLRNGVMHSSQRLYWLNPLSMVVRRGKQVPHLVPNVEYFNPGSRQNPKESSAKTILDFTDAVSVMEYNLKRTMMRPSRLRSFLCNNTGTVLLAAASSDDHAFFSHDMHHLLEACFLRKDATYKYVEKENLLQRLALLQDILMQGIPVVTNFLIKYLAFWSGKEYFEQVLSLLEWVSVGSYNELHYGILKPLQTFLLSLPPLTACTIFRSLIRLYANLTYTNTRKKQYFLNAPRQDNLLEILTGLSEFINSLCNKCLQAFPDDSVVTTSCLWVLCDAARVEMEGGARVSSVPPAVAVAVPLASCSAGLLEQLAYLLLLYRNIYGKRMRESADDIGAQIQILDSYKEDITNCLWNQRALSNRGSGALFNSLGPKSIQKIKRHLRDPDGSFGLGSHLALLPYTYLQFEAVDDRLVDNRLWLENAVRPVFPNLSKYLGLIASVD